MSNLNDPLETSGGGLQAVRVAELAGAEQLGASLYELQPAEEMAFHYHVQREELLMVLAQASNSRRLGGAPGGRGRRLPPGRTRSAWLPERQRSASAGADDQRDDRP
jgi:hypothetical protein